VTSEKNPKLKSNERKAMATWAASVHRGQVELFRDLASREHREHPNGWPLAEHEHLAIEMTRWLADLFVEGAEPRPEDVAILERLGAAFRPAGPGAKQVLAVTLIEEHAQRYQAALPDYHPWPEPRRPHNPPAGVNVVELGRFTGQGKPPPLIAEALAVALERLVHEGFSRLLDEVETEEIGALLERWEPGKEGRRGGSPAAAGILKQLNAMAGEPLGKLTVNNIGNKLAAAKKLR
jgi:hypothetical protein